MDGLDGTEFDTIMLVFRVLFGLTFAAHGYAKLFRGGRLAGTARWFESMGMKPGRLHGLMAASTELGSGLLMALGLLTPIAAAGVIGVMVVAGWTVHRNNGFFIVAEGWEYTFVLALVAFTILGFILDQRLNWNLHLRAQSHKCMGQLFSIQACSTSTWG